MTFNIKVAVVATTLTALTLSASGSPVSDAKPTPLPLGPSTHQSSQKAFEEAIRHLEASISDWNVATHSLKLSADFIANQQGE